VYRHDWSRNYAPSRPPRKPSIQALERARDYLKLPNGRVLTGQPRLQTHLDTVCCLRGRHRQMKIAHKNRRRRIEFLDFMHDIVVAQKQPLNRLGAGRASKAPSGLTRNVQLEGPILEVCDQVYLLEDAKSQSSREAEIVHATNVDALRIMG
jgi:hypothetical protein